jgi:hypothetical protein
VLSAEARALHRARLRFHTNEAPQWLD